jgi:DNA-binding SARP family transcriptional activator/ABC-type branched-subunit amino acid transport system substrate-binding protein/DNA-binding beta-propeller fold protein YncE
MEFRLLGPLKVSDADRHVALGGGKQRALLALLLLHPNEVLTSDWLIDALWGEAPPPTAPQMLQNYVSRLRRALGPDGSSGSALETHGSGYLLRLGERDRDLDRFEELLRRGQALRAEDPKAAAGLLSEALALWRGRPLSDFTYEDFARDEIARLEELRLVALEERIDADLALGRHADLVAELTRLVGEHPLRERLRAQLMLALYRSGRQAEALEGYRTARRALLEERGLKPGPALRDLEAAILREDPELGAPARPPAPMLRTRRRAGLLITAGGCALLAAAVAAAVLTLSSGGGRPTLRSLAPGSVGQVDPRTGAVVAEVLVPGGPARLAATGGHLWVASDRSRTLSQLSASTRAVSQVVAPGTFPTDLAGGRDALWVLDAARGRLVEISPAYGSVARRVAIDRGRAVTYLAEDRSVLDNGWSLAVGMGSVWVTDGSDRLARIDPATGRIRSRIDVGQRLNGVAVGEGAVWAIGGPAAAVSRVDPGTGLVTDRVPIVSRPDRESPYPIAIEARHGSVWVLNGNAASVTRIDARERGVTATVPIGVDRRPLRLAVGRGAAWVANGDGTLSRIDADTNAVSTAAVAPGLLDVAVGRGAVWVTAGRGPGADPASRAEATTGSAAEALPASICSPIHYHAGARPRLLIASDLAFQGPPAPLANQMNEAIKLVLRSNQFRAGRYAVGYQACDDSTVTEGPLAERKCASNAKAYADNRSVIGVVGPMVSQCAVAEIPVANRARLGPLPIVSPSNTYVGLTRHGSGTAPGEPEDYYPTGTRNYVRIVATDDFQAAADAVLGKRLGLTRVYVLRVPRLSYGTGIAAAFRAAAAKLGMGIAGLGSWTADQAGYAGLVRKIERSGADGVFLGGGFGDNGETLIKELRAGLGRQVQILAPDGFAVPDLVEMVGPASEGMTVSVAGVPPEALKGAGERFVSRFRAELGQIPEQFSVYAAQATQLLLHAIARSDGTRASVIKELFASRVRNGILGDFSITATGDTTANAVTIYRITDGKRRLFTVITPPPTLVGGF